MSRAVKERLTNQPLEESYDEDPHNAQRERELESNRCSDEEPMEAEVNGETDNDRPREQKTRQPNLGKVASQQHRGTDRQHGQSHTTSNVPKKRTGGRERTGRHTGNDPTAFSDDETDQQLRPSPQSGSVAVSRKMRKTSTPCHWHLGAIPRVLVVIGIISLIAYPIVYYQDGEREMETVRGHSQIMKQLLVIPKMSQLLDDWTGKSDSDDNTMSILVTGKTGVGKSTLINGIIGKRVIPVQDNVLKPATEDVEAFNLTIGEVEIKVWDTHGFQEGTRSGDEKKYLEDMKRNCEKVDLVLYCLRMDDTRMRPGDTAAVEQLTTTFGKSIWDHALFVLTFANRVEPPKKKDRHKLEEYFSKTLDSWVEMLGVILKKNGVSMDTETVRRKAVPAGYEEAHLPGRKFWLSDLWLAAFHESSSHAKPLLLAINSDRMTDEDRV